MTVQITIIGLGQIGSSIGLALKARNLDIRLVGHDKDVETAKEAQKLGAVHEVRYNLPSSVRDAKIVILALPFAGIRETLEVIAPDLQEGTLVLDTAPSKATVAAWVKELIPAGRFYIGLTPAINPEYLHDTESGVRAARADLFERGLMAIDAPIGTPEDVFNLTMDFVTLFGARPLLMDNLEADGIFAAMELLPQLTAAALLDTTVDKPGWQEARKLAGRPYASVTAGMVYQADTASLRDSVLENRENMVRLLNAYITSLIQLRDEIEENDRAALAERLENAQQGRNRWFGERLAADWLNKDVQSADVPSIGERMNQIFFGSLFKDRAKPRR
jgi:prephenate dehydrogenase